MFAAASVAANGSTFCGAFNFSFGVAFSTFALFSWSAAAPARFVAMLLDR
jgi:hypothetical protein